MAKLKKRAPMKAPGGLQRNFQQVYDDLNDIVNSVNSFETALQDNEGKPGDIKISKKQQTDGTQKYFINVKTDAGWVEIEGTLVG